MRVTTIYTKKLTVPYGGAIATCASGSKITYAYDTVGNRTSQVKFEITTNYWYDAGDELCWSGPASGSSCSTVPAGNTANTYDADGNQTGEGTQTFSYDLAGRLLSVVEGSTTLASFGYDGLGNRLSKTAGSATTSYDWDENNGELPMLALELNGSTVLRDYVYGGEMISMLAGGAAYYFHHDDLGTVSAVTKSTGATEWTYTYDPYGVDRQTTKVDSAAPDNPIQYTGQLVDPETSLYDLRARMYDPANGRFLSSDPTPEQPSDPATAAYVYASDQPLALVDPSGMTDSSPDANSKRRCKPTPYKTEGDDFGQRTVRVEYCYYQGRVTHVRIDWSHHESGGFHFIGVSIDSRCCLRRQVWVMNQIAEWYSFYEGHTCVQHHFAIYGDGQWTYIGNGRYDCNGSYDPPNKVANG